jgi:hypothetical protein
LEAGPDEYELAIKYGGLRESQVNNRHAVNAALGRLLRLALVALVHEDTHRR